jgi:26S proteasome regulatory subunit N11
VYADNVLIIFNCFLYSHYLCFCGQEMLNLAVKYNKAVQEEDELPPEKLAIANVGRQDAKKHLEEHVSNLMSSNIVQTLGTMLDTVVF